jgi:hypothetical protein
MHYVLRDDFKSGNASKANDSNSENAYKRSIPYASERVQLEPHRFAFWTIGYAKL